MHGAVLVSLFAVLAPESGAAPATCRILSNRPFAGRAHGLVGALGVDVSATRSPTDAEAAVSAALIRTARRMNPRLSRAARLLHRMPGKSRRAPLFIDRPTVLVNKGRLVLPELVGPSRARAGGGTITVTPQGWSAGDTARLTSFVAEVLPVIEQVYGKPAFSGTVTLLKDTTLATSTNPHEWLMGSYDVSTNTIHMPPFGSGGADSFDQDPEAEWNVTHMLIHAFHGSALFGYDAWEEGFARAASIVVMAQLRTGFVDQTLRPSPNWKGPGYEPLNQPELAAAGFFNGFEFMALERLWAAPMAWLKVYAESSTFFKDFNEAYYAQFDPDAAVPLSGNVPALKQLAASLVPTVEGIPFAIWFNQQHILNSTVTTGRKLFVAAFPSVSTLPGTSDPAYGPNIWLHYFETDSAGVEHPLNGKAEFLYRNDSSGPDGLFAEEGNEATITDGVGLHSPLFFNTGSDNTPEAQQNLIEIETTVDSFFHVIPYPHYVVGTVSGDNLVFNDLCGSVLGSAEGTLSIVTAGGKAASSATATVHRSVFKVPADTFDLSGPLRLTLTYTSDSGQAVTFHRNLAYDYSVIAFRARDTATTTVQHTFTSGGNGFHLMSVPVRPVVSDEASVLGIDPAQLLLARYVPRKVPTAVDPGRYELYPNLGTPITPGQGYVLRVLADTPVEVEGELVSSAADFEIPLPAGFNLVGQPFNHRTDVTELKVKVGNGSPVSFSTAQSQGLVGLGVWTLDAQGNPRLLATSDTLDPWHAYWVRVTNPDGATLVIPPLVSSKSRTRAKAAAGGPRSPLGEPLPTGGWCLRISARTDDAADADNWLGVAVGARDGLDNRLDIIQPPTFQHYVSLYFPHVGSRGGETRLAADFRAPFGGAKTWDMVVETDLPQREIRLAWGDLGSLPRQYRPVLVDVDGGISRYMRTSTGYTFRATTPKRRFQILVDGSPGGRLTIGAITPARGPRGFLITYNLSAPAAVTARIVGANGRPVRELSPGRAAQPGLNTLFWDLRDAHGRAAPRGFYLLQMVARDDQGRVFRAARGLRVLR